MGPVERELGGNGVETEDEGVVATAAPPRAAEAAMRTNSRWITWTPNGFGPTALDGTGTCGCDTTFGATSPRPRTGVKPVFPRDRESGVVTNQG